MLNKELVSLYAHSMRVVNNLTIIKMSHTKYQVQLISCNLDQPVLLDKSLLEVFVLVAEHFKELS
jgi:hypothetical protein